MRMPGTIFLKGHAPGAMQSHQGRKLKGASGEPTSPKMDLFLPGTSDSGSVPHREGTWIVRWFVEGIGVPFLRAEDALFQGSMILRSQCGQ